MVTRRGHTARPAELPPTLRHSLRHVTRVFHVEFRAELLAHDLSLSEYEAMFAVRRVPGMSSAELARWAAVSPQSANQVLRQLEGRGLVKRRGAPGHGHGRIVESRLTAKGAKLIQVCERAGADIEQRMTAGMTAAEKVVLSTLLATSAGSLGSPIGAGLSMPSRLVPTEEGAAEG